MDRCRDPSASVNEVSAGGSVYIHDGCRTEEAAELYAVTYCLSGYRNESYCRSLVIKCTKSHLVSDDAGDRLSSCVTGNGDHIKTYGAYACHCFKLFELQGA